MPNTVDQSDFVSATLTIGPTAVPYQNFSLGLAIGDSNIIDVTQRWRQYATLTEVGQDFGSTSPEYLAAEVYFEQTPQPDEILIGRWARTATSGLLHGASLTSTQQVISNFTTVTSGSFFVMINGVPYAVTGLNFSAALNMNGVASVIQTALNALLAGTTCVWNASIERFDITSPTTGATSSVGYGAAPTAIGSLDFTANPANLDTVTLGGSSVEFVTSGATGLEVNIGLSASATALAFATFANGSADTNISQCSYFAVGSFVYIVNKTPGAGGDSFTLAKTSAAITLSGSTLAGATGTDVSTLLGLTAAAGASPPVPGIAAETPLAAITALAAVNSQWYEAAFAASVMPVVADYEACAAFVNGLGRKRIFGVTITTPDCLDPTNTSDLASNLQALNIARCFWWYDPSNPYGVFSMMGRSATINFNASDSAITLAYKQAPGLQAAFLTETQFATLQGKGGNCNVAVNNGAVMIYPGQMSNAKYLNGELINGNWFDEIQLCDWFVNEIQTDVFNLLYGSTTKIPQTDAGDNIIASTIAHSCQKAVVNGMCAPGVWQGSPFGSLQTGDTLTAGYYIYYPLIATQSAADRATRKSVPFQIGLKLAGAIHQVDLLINVNR